MAHGSRNLGWFRRIQPDGTVEFEMINGPMEVGIPETPEYFAHERRIPAEMTVKELRAHIDELVDSGHHPARLIVRWHQKLAYPLSAFLMVFLALPFGLNRGGRRVTTMQGVALALVLGSSTPFRSRSSASSARPRSCRRSSVPGPPRSSPPSSPSTASPLCEPRPIRPISRRVDRCRHADIGW